MTQRNNGRKESEFPASTTLPSGAYLTYFAGGVNYKIDLSSFQAALSVTGSIVQTGSQQVRQCLKSKALLIVLEISRTVPALPQQCHRRMG